MADETTLMDDAQPPSDEPVGEFGEFESTEAAVDDAAGNGAGSEPDTAGPAPSYELDDRSWQQSLWRPLLITILAGCLVVALMAFARRLVPDLPSGYTQLMVAIGLLTAVIGCASTTWLAQPSQRGSRSAAYRAAELAFIIVITRITIWAATGEWPGFDLILRPIDALLDGYFIVGLIAVLLAWIMATAMTEDMIGMGLRPDDIYMARGYTDKWHDTARPVYTDRPAILRRFTSRWVVGGVLLVIMAAGSRFSAPEPGLFLPIIGQNIDRAVIIAVIVYFLVGLALISQGQLALLRARWTLQKTPSAPGILRNWPAYALLLILAAAFIAALLPLGGTFHLALILTTIIEFVYWLVLKIFGAIMGLFLLIASLFGGEETTQAMPTPAPPPVFTPEPPTEPPVELPPWTGGTIFWIIAALLLGYAAYIYFGGRGFTFAWLHQLWQMLRNRWNQMVDAYQDWQATHMRIAEDDDGAAAGRRRRKLMGWLGYRGLDPDAQVRYYYLSLLEQAEQSGHARHGSETPSRYAPRLAEAITRAASSVDAIGDAGGVETVDTDAQSPDQGVDPVASAEATVGTDGSESIHALTDAFVRVRYGNDHVRAEDATQLREKWNQLKRLLRL